MDKISKKKWFSGIDISKDNIDVGLMNEKETKRFIDHRFSNDLKGFEAILSFKTKS
jgi:transposase